MTGKWTSAALGVLVGSLLATASVLGAQGAKDMTIHLPSVAFDPLEFGADYHLLNGDGRPRFFTVHLGVRFRSHFG